VIEFKVNSIGHAGQLLLIGVAAGFLFWVVDKYMIMPVEAASGLFTSSSTQTAA